MPTDLSFPTLRSLASRIMEQVVSFRLANAGVPIMASVPPKAFISYSWSSDTHADWVLDLATQLRENGVDVTIDKWDLKEGHDAIAFMERMVTDPEITKVIVILDRVYAEKANSRKGGVGAETQIISPELYQKTDQSKFVGVISEVMTMGGRSFRHSTNLEYT